MKAFLPFVILQFLSLNIRSQSFYRTPNEITFKSPYDAIGVLGNTGVAVAPKTKKNIFMKFSEAAHIMYIPPSIMNKFKTEVDDLTNVFTFKIKL